MQEPPEDDLSLAAELVDRGKTLFELEKYTEAIAQFEQAQRLIFQHPFATQLSLGGEVQIWLANTYDVLGETQRAIAICQSILQHPDRQISKQANFLVSIFSALELKPVADVTLTLPNLANIDKSRLTKSYSSHNHSENLSKNAPKAAIAPIASSHPHNLKYFLIWASILIIMGTWGIWLYKFA
jgi:tetratricopeptide (TPR) repeat protein